MLLIEHYVGPSTIHGLGVFVAVDVPKGALLWEFNPLIDRMIPSGMLTSLPPHVQAQVERHSEYYPEIGCYVLGGDGDYFMNHADHANLVSAPGEWHRGYADRDIACGEELTCDYRETLTNSLAGRRDPMAALVPEPTS